ncbi:AraC family transcriptional regulator [Kocuria dechangensis]|uniref:AraC family transcriptional regulator n=1 Tax=Kocuria dechangensis TaxID=1176249 RepID=A0A917GX11_9MICC|nr:AraC family transcriptional regulator [Kocuria dechangensis]GGG60123.1 AraC family transcriptional regulator [Kocuria dechangensis]
MAEPQDAPSSSRLLSFSTAQIPASHRIEHWESHNAKALIGLDIRTLENSPLVAEEINLHFPALRFARVKGSSQIVERSERMIAERPTGDVAMFFALGGEAFFYHSTGMIMLKAGQAVLYDADQPFVRGFSYGVRELVLTVPHEEYVRLSRGKPLKEPVVFEFATGAGTPGKDPAATSLASLINSALRRPQEDPHRVEQQALALVEQLLVRAIGTDHSSAYRRALQEIDRRFADVSLNRAQVAAAAGVSERQLARLFAARGETFAEHLLAHRLQAAEALLVSEPHTPVAQIARRCGFASPSHFARSFKARTGVTPSELQRATEA